MPISHFFDTEGKGDARRATHWYQEGMLSGFHSLFGNHFLPSDYPRGFFRKIGIDDLALQWNIGQPIAYAHEDELTKCEYEFDLSGKIWTPDQILAMIANPRTTYSQVYRLINRLARRDSVEEALHVLDGVRNGHS